MPKFYADFNSESPPAKQVEDTKQLEPGSRKAAYDTGTNTLKQYTKDHPKFGALGDRQQAPGTK